MSAARVVLPLLLALGCGCPPARPGARSKADGGATYEPGAAQDPGSTDGAEPKPPEPKPPEPGPSGAGPAGPGLAGPSGPAGPAAGASLEAQTPDPEEGRSQVHLRPSRDVSIGGKATLHTWIVDGPKSRQLGLMYVREMPADRGMLFVYPNVRRRSFWMRNTYIPLSLAYVAADGTIEQILDMKPLTRISHPSKSAVRFVLEVNEGWFTKHGVVVGDRVQGIGGLRGY